MKIYKLQGGGLITAKTNQELVENLNSNSIFGFKENLQDFIISTAEGCKLYNGSVIRVDSIDNFVEDLLINNFITIPIIPGQI